MATQRRKDDRGRVLKEGESQRKDGRYSYRWTDELGKRRNVYASSLDELRKKEREVLRDSMHGLVSDDMKVGDLVKMYFEQKTTLKESTRAAYKGLIDRVILKEPFSGMKVRDVKKAHVLALYRKFSVDKGWANGTIATVHRILNSAFAVAVDNDMIYKNPVSGCMREYTRKKEVKYSLTLTQEKEMLDRIDLRGHTRKYKPLFAVMLYTGMRSSEVLGLTWDNVDFEQRVIHVNHQLQYVKIGDKCVYRIEYSAKTSAGTRDIPMTNYAYEYLQQQVEIDRNTKRIAGYNVDGVSNFVFRSQLSGKAIQHASLRSMLRGIVDDMNPVRDIQLPAISPHILRHTFCTRLFDAGTDIKTVQYIMGHADPRVTMQIYNHLNNERLAKESMKIDEYYKKLETPVDTKMTPTS